MKNFSLLFICVLMLSLGYGQTYNSPYTQNLTNQQIEQIDRTITIGDNYITIESIIDDTNSDIQQLKVVGITENHDTFGDNLVYYCTSIDGLYPTLVMVYIVEPIKEIHLIQPLHDASGEERYRFLID